MPDIVLATVAALEADAGVQAQIAAGGAPSPGVFDFEIPLADQQTPFMPTRAVVVKPHGGPKDLAPLQLNYSRIQVQCFGETPHLAYVLYFACYLALKAYSAQPSVWANTYIHNWIQHVGPISGRDPVMQWPFQMSMWEVKASDLHP